MNLKFLAFFIIFFIIEYSITFKSYTFINWFHITVTSLILPFISIVIILKLIQVSIPFVKWIIYEIFYLILLTLIYLFDNISKIFRLFADIYETIYFNYQSYRSNKNKIRQMFNSTKFYKVLNKEENHNYYQYKTGLNILIGRFNDNIYDHCGSGGLYFTTKEYINMYKQFGDHVRIVTLPWDDVDFKIIYIPTLHKFRANKIILGKEKYYIH